jgi:ubiquinone/menaquinone biosynthesis C-methylase UbiE
MNDAMSFGIHRIWKDVFIQRLGSTADTILLDVAGGTGNCSEGHKTCTGIPHLALLIGSRKTEH